MAVAEDLRIIGVKVDARDAADEVVDRLDQMVEVGIGAEIGHVVPKHRRQESKAFLKSIGDTVQVGGAAVLVVCDPPNAEKLLAGPRADYPGHETVDLSAAEQEDIINGAREAVATAS